MTLEAETVNSTPHRAHFTRVTHANFSRVHVAQNCWLDCRLCVSQKTIPSLPCIAAPCFAHLFLHLSLQFTSTCSWFVYFSLAVILVDEPKSLIEVSSKYTPIVLPSRRCSLDMNVDDASEACDISDVGRLSSPLFSQKREVSAIPFCVSCSRPHSSIGNPR